MRQRRQPPAPAEPGLAEPDTVEPGRDGPDRVCLGVVAGAHGVQGAVRLKSFAAVPEDIAGYGPLEDERGVRHFTLRLVGTAKGVVVAMLSGIGDRDQAEALRGMRLYLKRAALPSTGDDEYYHADLIGLDVTLADGSSIGRVRAIHDFGAGDTIEIARPGLPPALAPFTRAIVPIVDVAGGRLVLDPPPGLLEAVDEPPDEPGEDDGT